MIRNNRIRLALFAPTPVHYRVPLYRRIAADPRIDFTAIFASSAGIRPSDAGYGRPVIWDSNLTDGYKVQFLRQAEVNPAVLDGQPFTSFHDLDIISWLVRGNFDVLWLWGYAYLTHMLAASTQALSGRPILFGEDQTQLNASERPLWKRTVKKAGLKLLFTRGVALYVGTNNYRWFRHYGMPPHRMYFTPYAVDNDRLQNAARELLPSKLSLRSQLRIRDQAAPVVLFVGRLIPKKQPLLLLEAFRRVREDRPCSLLVVGSGELEEAMRRKIRDEQIPDVYFAGFMGQTDLPRAYASADILVLPSIRHETWGMVVAEAMNFGLPIIASDKVGSAADLVRNGVNGYVVSALDPSELTSRLDELVSDSELRKGFGQQSLEIVTRWNNDEAAKGVLDAVAAVVGSNRWGRACGLAGDSGCGSWGRRV